jgi:predicted DNA-binding transcriptional regulator YafY
MSKKKSSKSKTVGSTAEVTRGGSKFRTRWRHIALIDQRIRGHSAPNCNDLTAELEVSRRTILRDIDFMRYDLGAPIEYDAKQKGYVYTEPSWSMPNIRLTEGDLLALGIAEKAIEGFGNSPWAATLRTAFEKLAAALPDTVEFNPVDLAVRYDFTMSGIAVVPEGVLETLQRAIRENRQVEMHYARASHGDEKDYLIEPYLLLQREGAWYVAARDMSNSRYVPMFNLSRVQKLKLLDSEFEYILSDFDREKYLSEFGLTYHGKEKYNAVIDLVDPAALYVSERIWHKTQSMRRMRDGRLRFEVTVTHLHDILPWVLRWGSAAKVVKPKALVDLVAAETKAMAKNYFKNR